MGQEQVVMMEMGDFEVFGIDHSIGYFNLKFHTLLRVHLLTLHDHYLFRSKLRGWADGYKKQALERLDTWVIQQVLFDFLI